jgi:hypothetical protein
MAYRNEKFGHELWHNFFTAALTGLISTAYDKGDLDPSGDFNLEAVRDDVIFEAALIADHSMEFVIRRSANRSSYADADDLLTKACEKELEALRIFNEEINDEHRREADLTEEFSEAELQEMKDV